MEPIRKAIDYELDELPATRGDVEQLLESITALKDVAQSTTRSQKVTTESIGVINSWMRLTERRLGQLEAKSLEVASKPKRRLFWRRRNVE